MLSWVKDLFQKKTLRERLNETKVVKINGVRFVIRRIGPLSYLDGSNTLISNFDVYQMGMDEKAMTQVQNLKKLKSHFSDVIIAGTVRPQFTRKPEEEGEKVGIEELMQDFETTMELYSQIMLFTYGKKKVMFKG